jgi:hypothetical protein
LQLTVSALQDRYLRLRERCTQHEIIRKAANRLHIALLNAYSPDPSEMCDWLDDLCAYEMIQLEDALTAFEEVALGSEPLPEDDPKAWDYGPRDRG